MHEKNIENCLLKEKMMFWLEISFEGKPFINREIKSL